MSENPVKTSPIKNKESIRNWLLMKGQSFLYKKGSRKFLAYLKRVKMLAPKPTKSGNEKHNSSLFNMSNISDSCNVSL